MIPDAKTDREYVAYCLEQNVREKERELFLSRTLKNNGTSNVLIAIETEDWSNLTMNQRKILKAAETRLKYFSGLTADS